MYTESVKLGLLFICVILIMSAYNNLLKPKKSYT